MWMAYEQATSIGVVPKGRYSRKLTWKSLNLTVTASLVLRVFKLKLQTGYIEIM